MKNILLPGIFLFCTKSCFSQSSKRSRFENNQTSKPINQYLNKKCFPQVKQFYVDLRANVHITDVSKDAKEHIALVFCIISLHYCYFLPHFVLLFDHRMQLTLTPRYTTFLLLAWLSRDFLWQHNLKILKLYFLPVHGFVFKPVEQNFLRILAARRNLYQRIHTGFAVIMHWKL